MENDEMEIDKQDELDHEDDPYKENVIDPLRKEDELREEEAREANSD